MGGNALKHLHPVRLSSAEVVALVHHLERNWQLLVPQPLHLVPWVAEKADHGDIDLICCAEPQRVLDFCRHQGIDVTTISRNDSVLSVPVPLPWDTGPAPRIAQVDFICCSIAAGPAMRFFYAGGDFGMLLGRVAAWHGLVFAMDGLRYRADANVPWQRDVHLTADPADILRLLGYPPQLPWFDTYERLWSFILSSPLAGPWMFLPKATNAENRSRDRQRRKVGDFQSWLTSTFPDHVEPPAPRATPELARDWVRRHLPHCDIDGRLARQEAAAAQRKRLHAALGMGAVADILVDPQTDTVLGDLVRDMQPLLPSKAARAIALGDPQRWADLVHCARLAAIAVAHARGLATRPPSPAPPWEPLVIADDDDGA